MAKLQTMQNLAKEVAEKALQGVTLNGLPLQDFIEKVNNAYERNECHLASCRYNSNGICQNEDKRKECVDVSRRVLCLEIGKIKFYDNQNGKGYNPCEYADKCGADRIEATTFEDKINGKEYYVCAKNGNCIRERYELHG